MKTYHGSCHCGAVKFEVDAELSEITRCTCSMCSKKGGLFCYVPPDQFRLLQGEEDLTLYRFNTELAKHIFCKHCGIHAFGHPRSTPDLYLVNVRCLDDFDLETEEYEVKLFDGRNWEAAFKARRESG
ncbi:MAG: GFA family protein [Proteobacteria bacterium]|nr:GFA family protein [Pseudomonadota bacterium]